MRNLVEKQLSWLALLVTAFYSLLGSCRSADTSQECGHERLMNCARPLERINSNDLSFAITKEGLTKENVCPEFEASIKCIQTYTLDCLKEGEREHFNNLYAGTNKAVMELCQDGPYLDEFMKHVGCMQKIEPQYELCLKRYQRITEEIFKHNITHKSMQPICCGFKEYLDCSLHTVRRHCGDDTAQFTKDFLDRASGLLLGTDCKPYTEEVCAIGSGASISRILTAVPVALVLLARYFT